MFRVRVHIAIDIFQCGEALKGLAMWRMRYYLRDYYNGVAGSQYDIAIGGFTIVTSLQDL